MNKINLEQIQEMCTTYSKGNISMEKIEKMYNLPKGKFRQIIAKAIIYGYIDLELAYKIQDISIKNSFETAIKKGFEPNDNIQNYYIYLINASLDRKKAIEDLNYYNFILDGYDDNILIDEDFPFTKEQLLYNIDKCKEIIKKAEKMISKKKQTL